MTTISPVRGPALLNQPLPSPIVPSAAAPAAAVQPVDTFDPASAQPSAAQALWAKYMPGVSLPPSRSLERALTVLSGIEPFLQDADPTAPGTNGIRNPLFLTEALLRAYLPQFGSLERPLEEVKKLEDAVGAFTAPSTTSEHEKAAERLAKRVTRDWKPDAQGRSPAIAKMVTALAQLPFGDDSADETLMRNALVREMRAIATENFDLSELQGGEGIHELRRKSRWIFFYNSLSKIPRPLPELLPASLIGSFAGANDELGKLKDRGEKAEKLAREKVEQSGGSLQFEDALAQAEQELGPKYDREKLSSEAQQVLDRLKKDFADNASLLDLR